MLYLWEIFVPTEVDGKEVSVLSQKKWEYHVRSIAKGLTTLPKVEGQWICPQGHLYIESMTPVRIACTLSEINQIADFTAEHYKQESVMFYRVSDMVIFKNYKESYAATKNNS